MCLSGCHCRGGSIFHDLHIASHRCRRTYGLVSNPTVVSWGLSCLVGMACAGLQFAQAISRLPFYTLPATGYRYRTTRTSSAFLEGDLLNHVHEETIGLQETDFFSTFFRSFRARARHGITKRSTH
jgi:hypothetical protein